MRAMANTGDRGLDSVANPGTHVGGQRPLKHLVVKDKRVGREGHSNQGVDPGMD